MNYYSQDNELHSVCTAGVVLSIMLFILVICALMLGMLAPGACENPEVYECVPDKRGDTIEFDDVITLNAPDLSIEIGNGVYSSLSDFTGERYVHAADKVGDTVDMGIDVSSLQGPINWMKVRSTGISFVFIRAGYRGYSKGELFEDKRFSENLRGAIATGMKVGIYVYSQAITPEEAVEEAELLIRSIGKMRIALPLVIDVEYADTGSGIGGRLYNAKLSKERLTAVVKAFCDTIRAAGFEPMIYSNTYMLSNRIDFDLLGRVGIWAAYPHTEMPYENRYDVWQYSWEGRVEGIDSNVDCNFMYS